MTATILDPLFASTSDVSMTVDAATFAAIIIDLEMAGELNEQGPDHFSTSTENGQLNLHRDTFTLIWVYDPLTLPITECFGQWDHHRGEFGIADYLRCAAMSAIDAGHSRADYLAEAVRREYNSSTAARCWSYVKKQEQ